MIKQTITKIISGLILFVFVVSFFQFALPVQAADLVNPNLSVNFQELWNNPNQAIKADPYKFSLKVLKSGILQNVIGCTGVVNTVATWMSKLLQSPAQQAKILADKVEKYKELLKSSCANVKASAELAGQLIPTVGGTAKSIDTIAAKTKVEKIKACMDQVENTDPKLLEAQTIANEKADAEALKVSCFDGIAIMLAKNQLTSMTHNAMNWVNTGYGGNPFFVQNVQNFANKLEQNVVETGIDVLLTPKNQNPYASDFARTVVASRGIGKSLTSSLFNLKSDLGAFITDPQSYYTDQNMSDAQKTQEALRRAQGANDAFANDFSVGGWDGWLALTQRDQNNPLGFTMLASQYLEDAQTQAVADKKDELLQNNGFLSQKKCVKWNMKDANGKYIMESVPNENTNPADNVFIDQIQTTTTLPTTTNPECSSDGWEIVTPGSIIKEQTTNYLASPQRQLEMVKTINDGINALFGVLISQLENAGLKGLSDSTTNPANWNDNINNNYVGSDGNTPYNNYGAYDGFNLTSDLGNTYIHTTPTYLGTWDAKTNEAITIGGAAPIDENGDAISGTPNYVGLYATGVTDKDGKSLVPTNSYYQVTTAGTTKLILDGYNGWAVGDRAFWDGSAWQNWKCYKPATPKSGKCDNQINPIKKRGVIQIQQDYIVAATEILGILPSVMTKLGELDYCIPGPNPSYQTNSADAQSAYLDWVGSLYVGPMLGDSSGKRQSFTIGHPGDNTYDNLANIFTDNPNVWAKVKDTNPMSYLLTTFNGYFYISGSWFSGSVDKADDVSQKGNIMNLNLDYTNNSLFQNFYEVFDKMMGKLYFNNMTSKYLNNETSIGEIENPGYIPMAESGLSLTANIMYHNDEITTATKEYNTAIAQAKANIAKLEPIKAEVSKIIATAQGRRDANLLKILNAKDAKTVKLMDTDRNGTVTATEYQKYYANCIAEENMNFYDAESIMNTGTSKVENCFDGIDNDLNGLIDGADPACKGATKPSCLRDTNFKTVPGNTIDIRNNKVCSNIVDMNECNSSKEYSDITNKSADAKEYQCVWK